MRLGLVERALVEGAKKKATLYYCHTGVGFQNTSFTACKVLPKVSIEDYRMLCLVWAHQETN